jgi:hypothetical protein
MEVKKGGGARGRRHWPADRVWCGEEALLALYMTERERERERAREREGCGDGDGDLGTSLDVGGWVI